MWFCFHLTWLSLSHPIHPPPISTPRWNNFVDSRADHLHTHKCMYVGACTHAHTHTHTHTHMHDYTSIHVWEVLIIVWPNRIIYAIFPHCLLCFFFSPFLLCWIVKIEAFPLYNALPCLFSDSLLFGCYGTYFYSSRIKRLLKQSPQLQTHPPPPTQGYSLFQLPFGHPLTLAPMFLLLKILVFTHTHNTHTRGVLSSYWIFLLT